MDTSAGLVELPARVRNRLSARRCVRNRHRMAWDSVGLRRGPASGIR